MEQLCSRFSSGMTGARGPTHGMPAMREGCNDMSDLENKCSGGDFGSPGTTKGKKKDLDHMEYTAPGDRTLVSRENKRS